MSEMRLGSGKSRRGPVLAAIAAAVALAAPAAAPAADPGLDEYTLETPDADRDGHAGSREPTARPEDLPPDVQKALADDHDGEALTKIATARELGAPEPPPAGVTASSEDEDDDDTSTLAAAGNALDSPASLALLAGMLLLALVAFLFARRRQSSL